MKCAIIWHFIWVFTVCESTVKPILSSLSKRRPKMVFKTDYCLMQVESIAECSKGSILQYFPHAFSYCLSLRSLFCLFLVAASDGGEFNNARAPTSACRIITLLNDSKRSLDKKWRRPEQTNQIPPNGWKSKGNTFLPSV